MTEPAYSAEDLRRVRELAAKHNITLDDLDEQHIAAEFAKVRRERDQAAEKLAEALRCVLEIENFSSLDSVHYGGKSIREIVQTTLADYERSAHEGE